MEQTSKEKEALKKASRVHKQKAERFEATLEKSLTQLQDKVRPIQVTHLAFLLQRLSIQFLSPIRTHSCHFSKKRETCGSGRRSN